MSLNEKIDSLLKQGYSRIDAYYRVLKDGQTYYYVSEHRWYGVPDLKIYFDRESAEAALEREKKNCEEYDEPTDTLKIWEQTHIDNGDNGWG